MFDPGDNRPMGWGSHRTGRMRLWQIQRASRWSLIQFAKFVLVNFDMLADEKLVEEVVDAWLSPAPPAL